MPLNAWQRAVKQKACSHQNFSKPKPSSINGELKKLNKLMTQRVSENKINTLLGITKHNYCLASNKSGENAN